MEKFFKSLKRQDGFTLVELMVVVAIIGLLSAVAIPNFKKYQAKSKISEAKLMLSSLYTAEASFFSDFNIYGNCLRYMGFDPQRERLNRYYAVGFPIAVTARNTAANTAAVNSGMMDALNTGCPATGVLVEALDANQFNDVSFYPAGKGVGGSIVSTAAIAAANAAGVTGAACNFTVVTDLNHPATRGACVGSQLDVLNMTFVASAVGYISQDNLTDTTNSGLTIDNNKIIRTRVNGF
jgi:type IV pilus assembly protein PilA